jgi:tripartite-type tricarboxylate transporter receptor subunit TctC
MHKTMTILGRAVLVAAAVLASPAWAQDFPAKPVKLVVGYSAGGPTDVLARVLAADMTEILGQSVLVENKPGAAGRIGTEFVARSAPDGYTITVSTLSHNVNVLLYPKTVKYDPVKDFSPVALTALLPMVAVTAHESPAGRLGDLVDKARKAPGTVTYGSSGNGGSAHLAAALLETLSGTQMLHVPFKGNGPALTEVMAGRVEFMFYPMVGLKAHIEAKRLKPLAVTTAKRHPDYPDVPTTAEQGLKGFEDYTQGIGMLAPAGTPAAVVAKLNAAVNEALKRPATVAKLASLGAIVAGGSPQDFGSFIGKDRERWERVIKAANVKVE